MEIRQNPATSTPLVGLSGQLTIHMVVTATWHLENVGTTPEQRHPTMAAIGCEPPQRMAAVRRFAASHDPRGVTHGPVTDGPRHGLRRVTHRPHHGHMRGPSVSRCRETAARAFWRRSQTAMAVPAGGVESQNGLSEGLSARGGKRTRVRRESPSKTPKNGS